MLINYARSSSWSNWDFCQQQYYINYVLGLPRESSAKALKGTATHKVLECLASIKKQFAEGVYVLEFHDNELGDIGIINPDELLEPYKLSNDEIDTINKSRINKSTYKDECKLPYGLVRYGVPLVENLITLSCNHYAKDWNPVDYKDVANWVWMLLDHNGGMFDPRRRRIIAAEPHFDFMIEKDWAKYNWALPDGKEISGFLRIRGTIDLISEVSPGIIEIIDFKTGQRLDWASKEGDKVKTYKDLQQDFQLMLYYYAAKRMYPKVKQVIVTIFWIRDGGPFSLYFDDETLEKVENRLRDRFNEIKACQHPQMQDPTQTNFKCRYICDYYKTPSPDGKTNMCRFIHDQIEQIGIEEVTNKYTHDGFSIGKYDAPGEVS